MSEKLLIPTLVPEWAKAPDRNESESSSLRRSQSRESSSQSRPTYHGIIELNLDYIVAQIKPLASLIENENRRRINEFNLGSSIGYGQFGKVYKARYQNHIYAIKSIAKKPWNAQQYSMNQTMKQIRLWRQKGRGYNITGDEAVMMMNVQKCRWEIYILSTLHSPYVVQLYKFLDSPISKAIWIVNEWCSLGELEWKRNSVDEIPSQWTQLLGDFDDIFNFVEKALYDLTQGLVYLKMQGCIHRDIKPSNILVDGKEKILKLSDFGCSILTPSVLPFQDDSLGDCFQAELNKIVGTPAFIAPELCQFGNPGSDDIRDGFKLDIWSAGVTLYGLLYNHLPFYGESEFDTYDKTINQSLENCLNGNRTNDLIIGRMLEKDPEIRINIEKLEELVKTDHKTLITPEVKQGKKSTTAAPTKKSPSEKNQTGIHKFFNKFFKLGKKDKTKNNSVTSSANPSSGSPTVSSGTVTSVPADMLPNDGPSNESNSSLKPGLLPQDDDDFSEPSLHSSLSSFEEPVQVSDLFKQSSTPLNTQDNPLPSDSGIIENTFSESESDPHRIDGYQRPHSTPGSLPQDTIKESDPIDRPNINLADKNEEENYDDEPRRLDGYDLPQHHDFPIHSRQFSIEPSEISSRRSNPELKTPPSKSTYHSRHPSSFDRQVTREINLAKNPHEDYYDTSLINSKQPSFQLSLPPEMIQERSPQPIIFTSQPSAGSATQSERRRHHHPTASMSTSSSSPIKIPTPMKALIHMGNSPVKEQDEIILQPDSPLKNHSRNLLRKTSRLAHSKDISNFQNYILHHGIGEAPPQDKHKSVLTEDLVEKYLNYADNS